MRNRPLRAVDLNLLPILDALLEHRNVTRAGEIAGLSQPAMSRALARLREGLDDPLLVRTASGFALTPKAAGLRTPLAHLLAEIQHLLKDLPFDPTTETREICIAMTDSQAQLVAPDLMHTLSGLAPGVRISVSPITADIVSRVASGAVDLVVAMSNVPIPPGSRSEVLAEDRLSVVVRRDHPVSNRGWQLSDYTRWPSVVVSILGDGMSAIDARLAAHGITRTIVATVPTFATALSIVSTTDYCTTISRRFALRYADTFSLMLFDPPFEADSINPVVIWLDRRNDDVFLQWVRSILKQICTEQMSLGYGVA